MFDFLKDRARTAGQPQGSICYLGEKPKERVSLSITAYGPETLEFLSPENASQALSSFGRQPVTWLEVVGVHDEAMVAELGEALGLHPLLQEDVVHTEQRPGIQWGENSLFLILRRLEYDHNTDGLDDGQISLVLTPEGVACFLEQTWEESEALRGRLAKAKRLRQGGPDQLLVALLDLVVDGYLSALSLMAEKMEVLQDQILESPGQEAQARLHHFRKQTAGLRRALWPLRDVLRRLRAEEGELISEQVAPYVRDVEDHLLQAIEAAEMLREGLDSMSDSLLAGLSFRQGSVMHLLTMISAIFIPLTFMAGIYGMNFTHMPELHWRYGYFAVLGLMVCLGAGLLLLFKRKKWI